MYVILDSKPFGPQFVDTLFIIRLRLNLTMCCVLIFFFFSTKGGKVELKIYYYCLLKFCMGLMKSPWDKSIELTTKLMCTIMLIQNINHSFIVVSRKYTNLNWQSNTFFFFKKNFTTFRVTL